MSTRRDEETTLDRYDDEAVSPIPGKTVLFWDSLQLAWLEPGSSAPHVPTLVPPPPPPIATHHESHSAGATRWRLILPYSRIFTTTDAHAFNEPNYPQGTTAKGGDRNLSYRSSPRLQTSRNAGNAAFPGLVAEPHRITPWPTTTDNSPHAVALMLSLRDR